MCTPKKLLHRQQCLIDAIKRGEALKIRPPVHHQICSETHGEPEEIFEKYTRLLQKPAAR